MKYTPQQLQEIEQHYLAGKSAKELSQLYPFSERSIIAKLSSLGVYKRKQYLNKRGEPVRLKVEQIGELSQLLEVPEDRLESLEKCTKWVLDLLIQKLRGG